MDTLKSKITEIRVNKRFRLNRSSIFLDGLFAFSLDNEVIQKEKLKVGQMLSAEEVKRLTGFDRFERCYNSALVFLGYRPRSEAEVRLRLQKNKYAEAEIESVIARLKSSGLLNDTAFAEFWTENRINFKPRGQRMLKSELRNKGVEAGIITGAVEGIDELENARRAAAAKCRTLAVTDYQVFKNKLGGYLQRRGFDYGVISKIVKEAWKDRNGENVSDSEEISL